MDKSKKKSDDKTLNEIFDYIFTNALGNILILEETPTSDKMKANTIGYYNNEIFFKLANGELKKISVTDVA